MDTNKLTEFILREKFHIKAIQLAWMILVEKLLTVSRWLYESDIIEDGSDYIIRERAKETVDSIADLFGFNGDPVEMFNARDIPYHNLKGNETYSIIKSVLPLPEDKPVVIRLSIIDKAAHGKGMHLSKMVVVLRKIFKGVIKLKQYTGVRSVVKIMKLLETLAKYDEVGVSAIAKEMGESKSTLYRFLDTLKSFGYVQQNPANEKYGLTMKIFSLASRVIEKMDAVKFAKPVMEKLAGQTNETIHLATLTNFRLIYLHKIESTYSLRVSMSSQVGKQAPAYSTGLGKVLLSWKDPKLVQEYLRSEKIIGLTEHTITDPIKLALEFEQTKINGYALDNEENEIGICCIAAPIFDSFGNVDYAISLSGPKIRLTNDRTKDLIELVKHAAQEISCQLGYNK